MFRSLFAALVVALIAAPALADRSSCMPVYGQFNPTELQATNDYYNLFDQTFGATEASDDDFVVTEQVEIRSLSVTFDVAPGAGDQWDVIVRSGGASTALQCAVAGTSTSCADSDSASVAAGGDLTVLVTSAGGASDPTAAALVTFGFCVGSK